MSEKDFSFLSYCLQIVFMLLRTQSHDILKSDSSSSLGRKVESLLEAAWKWQETYY